MLESTVIISGRVCNKVYLLVIWRIAPREERRSNRKCPLGEEN